MEEVLEQELKEILRSFWKDKIPKLDGWTIEFFLALYDTIGPNPLQLVEETTTRGFYWIHDCC